ncbi:hypothetical protein Tco_0890823 [Tanacetum coccineum]|uniref:Uncharacterized protein n=1 Tax=Tanacetum coccineum TaxID=301880 RepID=A0ABQ5C158_9ASTR
MKLFTLESLSEQTQAITSRIATLAICVERGGCGDALGGEGGGGRNRSAVEFLSTVRYCVVMRYSGLLGCDWVVEEARDIEGAGDTDIYKGGGEGSGVASGMGNGSVRGVWDVGVCVWRVVRCWGVGDKKDVGEVRLLACGLGGERGGFGNKEEDVIKAGERRGEGGDGGVSWRRG